MKNKDIHKGLHKSYIRDFLSETLVSLYEKGMNNKKPELSYAAYKDKNPFEYSIQSTKDDIVHSQKSLKILEQQKAIIDLVESNGWEEWDVSDETIKDSNLRLAMAFIGNKKEYRNLIRDINLEDL